MVCLSGRALVCAGWFFLTASAFATLDGPTRASLFFPESATADDPLPAANTFGIWDQTTTAAFLPGGSETSATSFFADRSKPKVTFAQLASVHNVPLVAGFAPREGYSMSVVLGSTVSPDGIWVASGSVSIGTFNAAYTIDASNRSTPSQIVAYAKEVVTINPSYSAPAPTTPPQLDLLATYNYGAAGVLMQFSSGATISLSTPMVGTGNVQLRGDFATPESNPLAGRVELRADQAFGAGTLVLQELNLKLAAIGGARKLDNAINAPGTFRNYVNESADSTASLVISGANNLTLNGAVRATAGETGRDGVLGLQKTGSGTLTLNNANRFTAASGIILDAGKLALGHNGALDGSAPLIVNGGALEASGGARTVSPGGGTQIRGNFAVTGLSNLTVQGAVDLGNASRTVTVDAPELAFADNVASGGLIKTGPGTLRLSGSNSTFAGGLTVDQGTVVATASGAAGSGTVTVNGGTFQAGATIANPITLAGGRLLSGTSANVTTTGRITAASGTTSTLQPATLTSDVRIDGGIGGSGNLTVAAAAGATNPYSDAGTFVRGVTTSTGYTGTITVAQGARLEIAPEPGRSITGAGSARIVLTAGSYTPGATTGNYALLRLRASDSFFGTPHTLAVAGEGTALMELAAGNASLAFLGSLTLGGNQTFGVYQTGTTDQILFLGGGISLTGGNATLAPGPTGFGAGVAATIAATGVAETVSGSGLIVDGTGRVLLGNSTHTGITSVRNGTLIVDGTLSHTSGLTVVGGTFGGNATVSAPVTVGDGSGSLAFLEPGIDGIGTLRTGALDLARSDARVRFELSAATSTADRIEVSGALTLGASLAQIALVSLDDVPVALGTNFDLFTATGGITGTLGGLEPGSLINVGPNLFEARYTSSKITLVAVPEPATWTTLALAALALWVLGARRRRPGNAR